VPGIHVFGAMSKKDVDGRDKPGHDETDREHRSRFLSALRSQALTHFVRDFPHFVRIR